MTPGERSAMHRGRALRHARNRDLSDPALVALVAELIQARGYTRPRAIKVARAILSRRVSR